MSEINKHIFLDKIEEKHANELWMLHSSPKIMLYSDARIIHSKIEALSNISQLQREEEDNKSCYRGIFIQNNDKLIGKIGIYNINHKHKFCSIGSILSDKYWNMGISTKAYKIFTDFVFNNFDINRIEAQLFEKHKASERIFQKLGYQKEGILRENFLIRGNFCNSLVYSTLKKDWTQNQASK
ncbi:MAG: hypothetical protein C0594_09180 [Marinilabiliales bacterium]|nr:MAG: hypothetical protein C0594_09180 [Marinilabiliales bacterium]